MATKLRPRGAYGTRLHRAMHSTNPAITVRGLAKELRPNGVDSMRRLLRRFLKGERAPGPQVRGEIVSTLRAMGADTSELEIDEDEEESAMLRDLHDLVSLSERIRARFGIEVAS